MIIEHNAEDFINRSDAVLETCRWLTPVLNRVHEQSFTQEFWTRVLLPFAISVYSQKEYFDSEQFDFPVPFQAINGACPPNSSAIRRDRVLTFLRSLRGKWLLNRLPSESLMTKRVCLGARSDIHMQEFDAIAMSFNWMPFLGPPDVSARTRLLAQAANLDCRHRRNVCRNVPRIYIEYLATLLEYLRRTDFSKIENVYVEHYRSSFEMVFASYLAETFGAKIYQLQQGGCVGETEMSIQPITRVQYDYLLTYGWKAGSQDIPFYGLRLEQFAKSYRIYFGSVLKWDLLIVYGSPTNAKGIEDHYEWCTRVLTSDLDKIKFPRLLARPRAGSKFLRKSNFPKAFKMLDRKQIDKGFVDIAQLCARSSIVVELTTPSTNLLECIFVDKPVVGLDTNPVPTELVRPFLDFFHEVGVLHSTPEALVSFLNRVDLSSWWAGVTCDIRYQMFKDQFLRSRSRYLESVPDQERYV